MLIRLRRWLNLKPRTRPKSYRHFCSVPADVQRLESRRLMTVSLSNLVDPHPSPNDGFGTGGVALKNGNIVVTSPYDDAGGTDAGAVYLFNGTTGALISTLTGSHAGDFANCWVWQVGNSNFLVENPTWQNGTEVLAGAITWGSGVTGVSGRISAGNSLVGSVAYDQVGASYHIWVLPNGNYVVDSQGWHNRAGAVTFGDGNSGVQGIVSAANSLIGNSVNQLGNGDSVGKGGLTVLPNSDYLVGSPDWTNGTILYAGAITYCSGTTGTNGQVSAANSLVGDHYGDAIGREGSIQTLSNGNYVIASPDWNQGAGAVTFGPVGASLAGPITASNSLVGGQPHGGVGAGGVFTLSGGDYVVVSPTWTDSNSSHPGALTLGNRTSGVHGLITATNSLLRDTSVPTLFVVTNTDLVYHENDGPRPVAPELEPFVATVHQIDSATIRISGNYQMGQDRLAFPNTSQIHGSWNAATGTLTLTGTADEAQYRMAVESVTYRNVSDNPNTLPRTIEFSIGHSSSVSNTVVRSISVIATNDPPLLSNVPSGPLGIVVGSGPQVVAPTILVADPDSDVLTSATIQIAANFQKGLDVLQFVNTTRITGSWNASNGTLTLSGTDWVSSYRAALRSVTFRNSSIAPSLLLRTVEFQATDGYLAGNKVSRGIQLDHAPHLAVVVSSAFTYSGGRVGVAIAPALQVTDSDNANLMGAVVQIGNRLAGDELLFTNHAKIAAHWDESTGTLTFNGNASIADYRATLRLVKFRNLLQSQETSTRSISISVNDGFFNSNIIARGINVLRH